jgi:hypothetical protein
MRGIWLFAPIFAFASVSAHSDGVLARIKSAFSKPPAKMHYESNIPAFNFAKSGDKYEFDAYIAGNIPSSAKPEIYLKFFYFDKAGNKFVDPPGDLLKIQSVPADTQIVHLQGPGPRKITDIGGKETLVDGDLSHVHFSIPVSEFRGKNPLDRNVTSGAIAAVFPDGSGNKIEFDRVFHTYPEELKTFKPEQKKSDTLQVPVLLFADYIGQKPPQKLADQLKSSFDEIWSQCHIELKITGMSYIPVESRSQAQHPVDLSPEYYYVMRTLRGSFPVREGAGDIIAFNWRSGKPLSDRADHGDDYHQYGGITMDFAAGDYVAETFKSELAQNAPKRVVLFDDQKGLAHEIGHVLLGIGHKRGSSNLMGKGAPGEKLTGSQCKAARKFIQEHFSSQDAPAPAPAGGAALGTPAVK